MTEYLEAAHIIRETDKAVQVNVAGIRGDFAIWLPKSQIKIEGGLIAFPAWLMRDKPFFVTVNSAVAASMLQAA